ncbi:hypothetical protein E2562_011440 [Oryza meyeriana var. granulata]|uniref:Uncharacterized protein n=1 Tax=Oryza meyeriana var. granulata TaxID=110450 RepID=A0A6G1D2S8_9ORYZ|nr:hypothetical protein E2562_011440 [Oryza meyeriana var. granulata]
MDLQLPPCSTPPPPSRSPLHLPRHSIPLPLPPDRPLGLPRPAAAEGFEPAATLQAAAPVDGCGSVAVGDGRRGGQDGGAAALGMLTLERDAHQAGGHLAHQRGELQQQRRARAQVELEREVHLVAPVAVERANEPRADGSELADPLQEAVPADG